jgi:hypothetical protein
MIQTQVQIEKLRTLKESYDVLSDAVENQLPALADKIDNIKLPEIDTTELAKEATLNAVSSKLDNLNVEVDLSGVAKQGENQEATNSAIYEAIKGISIDGITMALENLYYAELVKNGDGDNTYTMIIPAATKKEDDTIII